MASVKYMGSSHEHHLNKGDNFGGRLSEGLSKKVVFSRENDWVVDTEEAGLSDDAVSLMLEDKETFKDVTGLDRVPTNAHQRIFLGLGKSEAVDEEGGSEEPLTAGDDTGEGQADITGSVADAPTNTGRGTSTRGGGAAGTRGTRGIT